MWIHFWLITDTKEATSGVGYSIPGDRRFWKQRLPHWIYITAARRFLGLFEEGGESVVGFGAGRAGRCDAEPAPRTWNDRRAGGDGTGILLGASSFEVVRILLGELY